MNGYTKLFSSIVDSSIWFEPNPTRIVWITMLAMANRDGIVEASAPGLAARSVVSLADCEAALLVLTSPDPHSKNPANEGRRIERIKEGWRLLNYEDYRHRMNEADVREKARIRKQKQRERDMSHSVTCGRECHDIAEAEADKKQKQIAKAVPPEEPPAQALPAELEFPEFRDSWERWAEYRKQARIKPYTKIGAAAQLKKLAELGKDRAIAAIENSIANAYQGIFEPKQGGNGHAAQKMEYVVGRGMVPIKK